MNIEDRIKKALDLRKEGYNCAQSVVLSQSDRLGISDTFLAAMTSGLGGGAACGELCGVANGIAISCGLKTGDSSSDGKKRVMPEVKKLLSEFAAPYEGKLSCRELKGKCGATCQELICRGIRLMES